jgi:hypothetical protein
MLQFAKRIDAIRGGRPDWYAVAEFLVLSSNSRNCHKGTGTSSASSRGSQRILILNERPQRQR